MNYSKKMFIIGIVSGIFINFIVNFKPTLDFPKILISEFFSLLLSISILTENLRF